MNEIHLFAGAGGGILGGLLLGHTTICAVEIDSYCQKILKARQLDGILPKFPIYGDIKKFDGKPWKGKAQIVAGGFPCQDISHCGKGEGIEGEKSGLWKEMARVIHEIRPAFAFVENSSALTFRGLGTILGDLAAMGMDARWGMFSAKNAGAPHKRERIWILAYLADANSFRNIQNTSSSELWASGLEQSPTNSRLSKTSQNGKKQEGHRWWNQDPAEKGILDSRTAESFVGRVAHGVANRMDRIKAIGNGQVPQCAAMAFRILSEGLLDHAKSDSETLD